MTEIERVWSARRNRYQGDVGVKDRERELSKTGFENLHDNLFLRAIFYS